MEVRIDCSCGGSYAFDVEPVDGQMPATVQCPTCGVDGTNAANDYIRQNLTQPAPASPASPPAPVSALPTSHRNASASPPPPRKQRAFGEPNLALGSLGAAVAALVAMMVWYFIIKTTNYEIGIIAWGVGVVVGFGCRILGGGYSQILGIIAGACALVAIVGGQYLATKAHYDVFVEGLVANAYDERMDFAQRCLAAETEADLRPLISEYYSDEDNPMTAEEISAADLQAFREEELPDLKAFVEGTPSRAEFEAELTKGFNSASMKALVLRESVGLWTMLWLALGVGSAFKLGSGETE